MSEQTQPQYKRILLKLSGEALRAPGSRDNISPEIVARIAREIADAQQKGNLQIAIVVGGGNIWRGRFSEDMKKVIIKAANQSIEIVKNFIKIYEV